MSSNPENELIFFLLADYNTKKEIGSYTTKTKVSDLNEILNKSRSIINEDFKSKKNKVIHKNFAIFHTLNKDNIFLLAVLNKSSKHVNTNSVFEFFEDIEHQSIPKFLDKNNELNNVGKQNLLYIVDKYFSSSPNVTNSSSLNNSLVGSDNPKSDKILQVTQDVNSIQKDMKEGIKKLVTNVENVRELENRAERINSTSNKFRQDAEALRKREQCKNLKFKIFFITLGVAIGGFLLYSIFS